ncbi:MULTISPECIES: PAS domain S-box protein [unclassified Bradyrhizobium]|uniref:PAS domain S-box protein n=1 Tax=unclassified Bradyrhizobium TaxID=2631580 RepID=UPI0028EE9162|nr:MULTISPECIES: PAS domain S-box protein [unclassified Bradyrhizobium]
MLFRIPDAQSSSRDQPSTPGTHRPGVVAAWQRMALTTRLAVAMILLVAIAVFAVGWLGYRSLEQGLLPRALDRVEAHARLMATELESYVGGARNDLASYRADPSIATLIRTMMAGGLDPREGLSAQSWRERVALRFFSELQAEPTYAMFRLVGLENNRRELIRVDRLGPNHSVRIVPEGELIERGDRPYINETLRLAPGQIRISPVILDGNTTDPKTGVPMLCVGTPVFAPDGKPFGVLMIDVDMRPIFAHLRAAARPGAQLYVVNARGDYLFHPDSDREFASKRGNSTKWQDDFPSLAAATGTTETFARIIHDAHGRPDGIAFAPALLAGQEWVAVIETIPNTTFMGPAVAIRKTALGVGLIAMLCAAALAFLVARSLTRPINQLTAAIEGIGRGEAVAIPVEAGGETGVLARAFARVMEEVRAKTAELEREVQEHYLTEAARDHFAERERLYSAAVESSSDAILTESLDGTITGWNPAAEQVFGYSAQQAVGRNIDLILPADRICEGQDILARVGRGERIQQYETIRLRKDGSPIQVSLSIAPIKSPSGQITGASMIARDITESRRTEQALRQQTEERRRIFESSQDLILITDRKGMLVQVSPSAETILGYTPAEMIGRSAADFLHPDDLKKARGEMRASRRGQRARSSDSRYMHKDGRVVTLSWTASWSEPVQRHFFIGRDMTESRLAQETLRESEQLARNIVETALDAFVQIDDRGSVLNWNSQAEKIFGWPRAEILGKDVFDLISVDQDRDELRAALGRVLLTGGSDGLVGGRRREIMVRRRDGREFKAELSVTALKTRSGFVFNGFFRDLTDKIAAEERIRQSEKMEAIGQLTGGIAHDFNNILTVITGTIEILAGAVAKEPQLAAITKMIDEAAGRGAALTQQLLAFARRQPLQPREIDINTLVIDTAKLLRPTLGEQIEIESVFQDESCVAHVDPNQLATAIINLALNARDAMPNGGKLILETGWADLDEAYASLYNDVRPGRYAMIAVSDSGTGIPSAILDKVFNPFFTSKGPGKGTGLGLSMVYGFVKQSAGHIRIYSEEGHGTTIRMYLPPGRSGVAAAAKATSLPIEGGNETILVVEDDRLVRGYVLAQLHSLGYATLEAANATEALSIARSGEPFDLLFTDIIMPGSMNGRQLASEIQQLRPGQKVLFTSGYTENAVVHHGRLDSGILLLAKPYRKSELARMIRKALAAEARVET